MQKNRGMFFETLINNTISFYRKNKIAVIHKKNLDIKFSGIKNANKEITRGWIKNKSTTDYYGIYKGRFITFEAKSTNLNSLPLSNIKEHQLNYLNEIKEQGGISFLFIFFSRLNKGFIVKPESLSKIKTKSISIDFVNKYGRDVSIDFPGIVDFIKKI